ncbi:hypothetical protein AUQ37_08440 [Candidatus Methanomethylophilus sp. 1R26]|jgi:hypothetical protein|nr:hypothetical protein AUQ37_08440 [Candidatus Methanomethylophilus sp. 1R26]TQS82612.1 MAG: hypothetical protein A3Q59_03725 [Methanomethylophilus alvi]
MMALQKGDIAKYAPTSRVGKITDIREEGGRTWYRFDNTGLYYAADTVVKADPSEYKAVSFKERKSKEMAGRQSVEDLQKMEREVDIDDMMPSGGG